MEDILRLTIVWPHYSSLCPHGFAPLTGEQLRVKMMWTIDWCIFDALPFCISIGYVVIAFANITCLICHKRRKILHHEKKSKKTVLIDDNKNNATNISIKWIQSHAPTYCKILEVIYLLLLCGIIVSELQDLSLFASVAFREQWVLLVSSIDPPHFILTII